MAHRNYYVVMKEIIIKWVALLDKKGRVDALIDFSKIQKKYNLSNEKFIPLISFIGLDDNGVQYDRLLELFLKNKDLKNYSRFFGLLLDLKTIDKELPEFAMATISYSLRTGTARVLTNRPGHKKTYKDFSLLGVACLALNAKISKEQILSTTKFMTSGYEFSKLRDWSDDQKKDPEGKILMHIEDAKKRVFVTNDIISKASICTKK